MALTRSLHASSTAARAPQRVYLTGTSMGGHVTLLGMHEFPTAFAGGLAMCPAGPELFDYFTAVGAAAEVDHRRAVHSTRARCSRTSSRSTDALGEPPNYTEKGRQLASVEINISGGPRPFAVEGLGAGALHRQHQRRRRWPAARRRRTAPSRTRTSSTRSTRISGLTPDELNAAVRRKAADTEIREPDGSVRRAGAVRRQDRAAGADDARHRRSVRADSFCSRR